METPLNRLLTTGSVVAVASSPVHGFSKPTVDRIMLIEGQGVKGDAHAGRVNPSCHPYARARARPWSARCYGVARQRDRSRQNSRGSRACFLSGISGSRVGAEE